MQLHRLRRYAERQTRTFGMTKRVNGIERECQVMHRSVSCPHSRRKETHIHLGFLVFSYIRRSSEGRMVAER